MPVYVIMHPKQDVDGEFLMREMLVGGDFDALGETGQRIRYTRPIFFSFRSIPGMQLIFRKRFVNQMRHYGKKFTGASRNDLYRSAIMAKTIKPFTLETRILNSNNLGAFINNKAKGFSDYYVRVKFPQMYRLSEYNKKKVGRWTGYMKDLLQKHKTGNKTKEYDLYVQDGGIVYKVMGEGRLVQAQEKDPNASWASMFSLPEKTTVSDIFAKYISSSRTRRAAQGRPGPP
jgi:hypothetical protein